MFSAILQRISGCNNGWMERISILYFCRKLHSVVLNAAIATILFVNICLVRTEMVLLVQATGKLNWF